MKNRLTSLLLLAFLLQSCYTQKPVYKSIEPSTFGGVHSLNVQEPTFKKKMSVFTWTFGISPIIIGGYLGKDLSYKDPETDVEKEMPAVGVVLGACIGGAVTGLILGTAAQKQGVIDFTNFSPSEKSKYANNWVRKYNRKPGADYVYSFSNTKNLILVPRKEESQFVAKTEDEVLFFLKNFPNSKFTGQFLTNSSGVADHAALAKMIVFCPNYIEIKAVKKQFILTAPIDKMLGYSKQYPDLVTNDELMKAASQKVGNNSDMLKYRTAFGTSTKYDDDVFNKLYPNLVYADLKQLIEFYPNAQKSSAAKINLINQSTYIYQLASLSTLFGKDFKSQIEKQAIQLVLNKYSNFPEFSKSFPDAEGLHKTNSGLYIGDWDYKNNYPTGNGVLCESGKDYCIGTFVAGKLKGNKCKVIWDVELTYEGQAEDGAPNGQGIGTGAILDKRYPLKENGVSYTGNWVDGWPSGTGKYSTKNTWIEGTFKRGYANGYATLRSPDGIRISGNFAMGNPAGSMKIEKWSLFGLLSSSATVNASTWAELNAGAQKVVSGYNSQIRDLFSSSGSSSSSSSSSSASSENDNSESKKNLKAKVNWAEFRYVTVACTGDENSYQFMLYEDGDNTERVFIKKEGNTWYNGCNFGSPIKDAYKCSLQTAVELYFENVMGREANLISITGM